MGDIGPAEPGLLDTHRAAVLAALTVFITLHRADGRCEDCTPGVECVRLRHSQWVVRALIRRRHGVRGGTST